MATPIRNASDEAQIRDMIDSWTVALRDKDIEARSAQDRRPLNGHHKHSSMPLDVVSGKASVGLQP
jgi:hypothetical protein